MKNKFDSWNNDANEFINGEAKLDSADNVDVMKCGLHLLKPAKEIA